MKRHYVIGDIHGEYQTLLALVEKLPKDANLIFVGDLIDRGLESKEVISFIRKNNYQTVMGNHESLFIKYANEVVQYLKGELIFEELNPRWEKSGRVDTFLSYGLVKVFPSGISDFIVDEKAINELLEDITWMKKLPLYLELDIKHFSGQKVVISHSNISKVWAIRNNKNQKELFDETTLWTREKEICEEVDIFNIYGHMPQEIEVEITNNYVNVDTGCCYFSIEDSTYGRLSAYCVESGEVIQMSHV